MIASGVNMNMKMKMNNETTNETTNEEVNGNQEPMTEEKWAELLKTKH
jgi:hypothetical protein